MIHSVSVAQEIRDNFGDVVVGVTNFPEFQDEATEISSMEFRNGNEVVSVKVWSYVSAYTEIAIYNSSLNETSSETLVHFVNGNDSWKEKIESAVIAINVLL